MLSLAWRRMVVRRTGLLLVLGHSVKSVNAMPYDQESRDRRAVKGHGTYGHRAHQGAGGLEHLHGPRWLHSQSPGGLHLHGPCGKHFDKEKKK